MNAGMLDWLGATDFGLAGLMTLISFGIVCVPFFRGLKLCVQALSATRRVPRSQLQRAAASEGGERSESLAPADGPRAREVAARERRAPDRVRARRHQANT